MESRSASEMEGGHGDIPEGGVCSHYHGKGLQNWLLSGFGGGGGANHARGSSRGVKSGREGVSHLERWVMCVGFAVSVMA